MHKKLLVLVVFALVAGSLFLLNKDTSNRSSQAERDIPVTNVKEEPALIRGSFESFFTMSEPMKASFPDTNTSNWIWHKDKGMGFSTKLPSNWTVTMEGSENVACKKDGRFSPQEKGKECNMDSWFTSCIGTKDGYYTHEEGMECPIQINKWPDTFTGDLQSFKQDPKNIFYQLEVNRLKMVFVLVADPTDYDRIYFEKNNAFWEVRYNHSIAEINQTLAGIIRSISFEK